MMISPESYYEMVLKGKSIKEINKEIQNLKQRIGIIKYQLEKASLLDYGVPLLSVSKNINIYKLYLQRAKDALSEAGGEYKPSKSDLKAIRFNENINAIIKIVFCIGGYKIGYETRNYSLIDDHFLIRVDYGLRPLGCDKGQKIEPPIAKELLLEGIKNLDIGEWRRRYFPEYYRARVRDGTKWNLVIYYSNGSKPAYYHGDNVFPYNFRLFLELLGLDDD